MTDFVTPRVNAGLLQEFSNGSYDVRIIGKVTRIDGDNVYLDSSGEVQLDAGMGNTFEVGRFYEVVGKIGSDLSVKVLTFSDFGTNIDMTNVDRLVAQQHKFKKIFYD